MKKITFILASCALCAVSCSQNESVDFAVPTTDNVIGFMSNTSRATTLTLDALEDDTNGFVVYGINALTNGAWYQYIDGTNNYAFANNNWGWANADKKPVWPTAGTDGEYPVNFYAYYTQADAADYSVDNSSESKLAITYTAPSALQHDLLTAKASTKARPAGDKLPLTFKHILSKVKFQITVGDQFTVHTQSIGFNDVCNSRGYLLATEAWGDQAASSDSYPYLLTKEPAIVSPATIEGDNGDLMLLPQTTRSWDPTSGVVSDSRIELIYRAVDGTTDVVGYTLAESHPKYDPTNADHTKYKGQPLFVKVGYPVGDSDNNLVLASGMSYNYNIKMGMDGATNGYVASEYLYDQDGNETTLEVDSKDVGDPITDGYINFTVDVNEWAPETGSDIM
ncbi:MAG: fimbrillin family protein [Rikenellaceae bacterium]